MKSMRRALIVGSLVWAVVVGTVALVALPDVNPDARLLVGVLSVVLPLDAILAAWALHKGNDRIAVLLLLVSVATPTYMAWAINLVPILLALAIVRTQRAPRALTP
jgi:hypothetical protein